MRIQHLAGNKVNFFIRSTYWIGWYECRILSEGLDGEVEVEDVEFKA